MNAQTRNPADMAAELVRKLHQTNSIPALDENVAQLCRLADQSETSTADLTAVIMRDAALTSRLLAIANSALYSPRNPIKTVSSAVIMLGFDRVRQLAFGLSLFHKHAESIRDKELYRLLVCTYCTGLFAMGLARRLQDEAPEELFVAGLLHQLPRLALFNGFPDLYRDMDQLVVHDKTHIDHACSQVFGASYEAMAIAMADHWKLPGPCRFYANDSGGKTLPRRDAVLLAVGIANLLFGNSPAGPETASTLHVQAEKTLKLSGFSLPDFVTAAAETDPNMEAFFHLSPKDLSMMARISEWGKVNSADVATTLTHSFEQHETIAGTKEPPLVMAHFLSELMIATRQNNGINAVLMLAQEGIFRCMHPACIITAFADRPKNRLLGRLYAGQVPSVQPARYAVRLDASDCLAASTLQSTEVVTASAAKQKIIDDDTLFKDLDLDAALLATIRSHDRAIGQFFLAKKSGQPPFSADDCLWMFAIAGHVAMAFESVGQ